MATMTHTQPSIDNMPKGRLALWILIAGELAIFGGFIMSYILYRLRLSDWGPQTVHTVVWAGALNTMVLLTSSFTIVEAHAAAIKKDLKSVGKYMNITLLLGVVFLFVKAYEYSMKFSGHHGHVPLTLTSPELMTSGVVANQIGSLYWSYYFIMTGLHATHVVIGMIAIFVVKVQAEKGKGLHRVELAGLYWHMVDLVWIFLFPLLYLAK